MLTLASAGLTAEWFLTRASGIVALILLTGTVALGVANVRRLRTRGLPRFVVDGVHRNVALLSVVFLLVHISTSVLDGYVSIRWIDAVVPFAGSYRPFWLGLGALAFDVLLAVVLSSLVRRRLGYRAWRATHWLAYACWPIALVHGLGIGTDAGSAWNLAITLVCLASVAVAVWARVAAPVVGTASVRAARTASGREARAASGQAARGEFVHAERTASGREARAASVQAARTASVRASRDTGTALAPSAGNSRTAEGRREGVEGDRRALGEIPGRRGHSRRSRRGSPLAASPPPGQRVPPTPARSAAQPARWRP